MWMWMGQATHGNCNLLSLVVLYGCWCCWWMVLLLQLLLFRLPAEWRGDGAIFIIAMMRGRFNDCLPASCGQSEVQHRHRLRSRMSWQYCSCGQSIREQQMQQLQLQQHQQQLCLVANCYT